MSEAPELRIEILSGSPDEAEAAAIVAAVLALQAEAVPVPQPVPGLSAWRKAALYENLGRDPHQTHASSLRSPDGSASLWPG
jgi:hypothetical protein